MLSAMMQKETEKTNEQGVNINNDEEEAEKKIMKTRYQRKWTE